MNHRASIHHIILYGTILAFLCAGCYQMRGSTGGGQIEEETPSRTINTDDIALPEGYAIEVVARGLTFPTGVTLGQQGRIYVTESGYAYGEEWTRPRLLRIESGGDTTVIASGDKSGPWNGVAYHEEALYVAEGNQLEGGRILRISPDGNITPLTEDLPSYGDHHTNGPVVRDGYVYFGQGTATNAGVVGNDNGEYGWLHRKQRFHDIPCEDITLRGQNYETDNILDEDADEPAVTGAYSPYGVPTDSGQVIEGEVPCGGSILRVPIEGGDPELVAWGFRNPFSLAFSPGGQLYVTDNGYDDRGSRPVWGAGDMLWRVQQDTWYGWPDFSGQQRLTRNDEFRLPEKEPVKSLLAEHPNNPPKPSAILGVHSSSNGLAFSTSEAFGYKGKAFVAQFGDLAPAVGKVVAPVGYKVVSVDVSNGVIEDFAVNRGARNGPASWLGHGGLERPLDVAIGPSGEALYIVDFGIMRSTDEGQQPVKNSGAVFKVTKEETQ